MHGGPLCDSLHHCLSSVRRWGPPAPLSAAERQVRSEAEAAIRTGKGDPFIMGGASGQSAMAGFIAIDVLRSRTIAPRSGVSAHRARTS